MTIPAPGVLPWTVCSAVRAGLCMSFVNSGEDGRDLHVLLEGISFSRPGEMARLEIVTGQRRWNKDGGWTASIQARP